MCLEDIVLTYILLSGYKVVPGIPQMKNFLVGFNCTWVIAWHQKKKKRFSSKAQQHRIGNIISLFKEKEKSGSLRIV